MMRLRLPPLSLALSLLLVGCPKSDKDVAGDDTAPPACDPVAANADAPALVAGAPQAGVAEGPLLLPVGTPLSGYTSRCGCFGGDGKPDRRDSAYRTEFAPSGGVQSAPMLKVFWLTNGDADLVIIKVDIIYSFDGLVEEMERRLSAATGKNMDGRVVVTGNHSHSAWGDFSDQVTYYLGSDRFNQEVFLRMASQMEELATSAHDSLQPVKIGVGYAKDWDPDDRVYHDRRPDNDGLQFFPDIAPGPYKDPNLTMLRIDTLDGAPLGVIFNFGIHGTTLDADNPMASAEAPGHVETVFQERFDEPVVVALLQGGTGDASPSGSDDGYARLETVGEYAADALQGLWSTIPTSAEPITLETVSRSVPETHQDIHVTRNGTTDMHYVPLDEELVPDNVVYAEDGSIIPAIDEYNVPNGAAFCGENPPYLPGYAPAEVFPYNQCVSVDMMMNVIKGFFDLSEEEAQLPILESRRAGVTASRFGPVSILEADGSTTTDDFFVGFFPGEPTALYTEQFRRRAAAELGYEHSMAVGYAQDHEGYLLIPEDWLMGGYEADINVWGPLQAEHIMEGLLTMSKELLSTDVAEDADPCGDYQPPDYGVTELPTAPPDPAPDAGTLLDTPPDYVYSPLYSQGDYKAGVTVTPVVDGQLVPRVQGLVEMIWTGGDPGVDWPMVTLERQGDDGEWGPVTTPSGRPVTNGPDILVTTTPDPLYAATDMQVHTWYAAWQAVDHVDTRAGLPEGTYRLRVTGKTYVGSNTTWPWDTADYEVIGPSFDVIPATITLTASGSDVYASLRGPERGYRLIGLGGNYRGDNPLPAGEVGVVLLFGDGHTENRSVSASVVGSRTLLPGVIEEGVSAVYVVDVYGNIGELTL